MTLSPLDGEGATVAAVEVTQADREAAAALLVLGWRSGGMPEKLAAELSAPTRHGNTDHCDEVQAFARHRVAAQAELLSALEDGLARLDWLLGEHSGLTLADNPMVIGQLSEMKLRLTAAARTTGQQP